MKKDKVLKLHSLEQLQQRLKLDPETTSSRSGSLEARAAATSDTFGSASGFLGV